MPVMHQQWSKLLFLHWSMPPEQLRTLVPDPLHIDTYDDVAWLGMTPFTMPRVRPHMLPAPPLIGSSHELNVRTYVHYQGVPGVWFLSLDANNPLAVLGARLAFALPYFQSRIAFGETGGTDRFTSTRVHPGAARADFDATWRRGSPLPPAAPGSLEFFLTERYCLYAARADRLYRSRIHHEPWSLCRAELLAFSSTMAVSHGLHLADTDPLVHGQSAPLDVSIWCPSRV